MPGLPSTRAWWMRHTGDKAHRSRISVVGSMGCPAASWAPRASGPRLCEHRAVTAPGTHFAWTNLFKRKQERAAIWISSDKCCFQMPCHKSSSQIKERKKERQTEKKKRKNIFLPSYGFQWGLLLAHSPNTGPGNCSRISLYTHWKFTSICCLSTIASTWGGKEVWKNPFRVSFLPHLSVTYGKRKSYSQREELEDSRRSGKVMNLVELALVNQHSPVKDLRPLMFLQGQESTRSCRGRVWRALGGQPVPTGIGHSQHYPPSAPHKGPAASHTCREQTWCYMAQKHRV